MEALVSHEVVATIRAAVHEGIATERELGGALLAHLGDGEGPPLLAYALPTGPAARQSYGGLRTDAEFQSRAIAQGMAAVPGLAYVGDWHVHPMWLPSLSSTDLATARAILDDEGRHLERLLLLLGTCRPGKEPELFGFAVSRRGAAANPGELRLREVSSDDPQVVARLGRPLPPLGAILAAAPAQAPAPGDEGGDRLQREVRQIEVNLGATVEVRRRPAGHALLIRLGHRRAAVLLPPEYPFGAPLVFAGDAERAGLVPIPLRFGWSSEHELADLLGEALAARVQLRVALGHLARLTGVALRARLIPTSAPRPAAVASPTPRSKP